MNATIATAGAFILYAACARAVVIYSEDFAGDGSSTLIGTAEDTTGTVRWEGNANFLDDGTISSARGPALLPFSPTNGNVYTVTVTLSLASDAEIISFGFSQFIDNIRFHNQSGLTGWAWMFTQPTVGQSAWEGPRGLGDGNVADGLNESLATGSQTLTIVLDTSAAIWTADFHVNGLVFTEDMELTGLGEGTINYVGLATGLSGGGGVMESFTLSGTAVPEPALILLGGIGLLSLLRHRR
jgi:hypothetical protein